VKDSLAIADSAAIIPVVNFFVYIATNHSRTLYVGVTNDLARRASEHASGNGSAFTSKYKCDTMVWYERFRNISDAIAAEKRIKGWTRVKKIALIEKDNPHWQSLVES
jgi:putative endonuclease